MKQALKTYAPMAWLLGLCLFTTTIFANPENWTPYSYPDGKIEISFPAEPKAQTTTDRVVLTAVQGKLVYQVIYFTKDYDVSNKSDWYNDAFGSLGTKKGAAQEVKVEDVWGREAKLEKDALRMVTRVYLGRNRCWILTVAKSNDYPTEKEMEPFFNSFKPLGSNAAVVDNSKPAAPTDDFDAYKYFKAKSFPHISNINEIDEWNLSNDMLEWMLETNLPEVQSIIEKYGVDYLNSASNASKDGVEFIEQFLKLEPIFPQIVDKFLAENESAAANLRTLDGKPRLLYIFEVKTMALYFHQLYPENMDIKGKYEKAQKVYEEAINAAKYISGEFHKKNLGNVVLFNKTMTIGKEDKASIVSTIAPDQGTQIIAYYPSSLADNVYKASYSIKVADGIKFQQQLFYWGEGKEELFKKTGYAAMDLFPDPAALNYKSHYQYDQYINLLQFLLDQPTGKHEVEFNFYTGAARPGSESFVANAQPIFIDISEANKAKMKVLHDQLVEKKINAVIMPTCTDNSNLISNKDGFKKYGTFMKYVQTIPVEDIKDSKWPHPVIGQSAGGWAAVEKADGTVELLPVSIYKATGKSLWSFTALGVMPSGYDMIGNKTYKPARGEFGGYIMKKANVGKCGDWEWSSK